MAATRDAKTRPHPRNKLNDLPSGEWLRRTKSFWVSLERTPDANRAREAMAAFAEWLLEHRGEEETERLLGQVLESFVYSVAPPRDELKSQHPATFSEADIERLVTLFTKRGETVLDPFVGVGSALIACLRCGRRSIGIELSPEWAEIAAKRVAAEKVPAPRNELEPKIIVGDSATALLGFEPQSVDFIVTSPPYWSILSKKPGMKAQAERIARGLATDYGTQEADLGAIEDYELFVERLADIFGECLRVLREGRYMAVIVSDFRHGERFYLYHSDLSAALERRGWILAGVTVLAQDNKALYPYGIPYAFVSNVHHQYILIFRKPRPQKVRLRGRSAEASKAGTPSRAKSARKRTSKKRTGSSPRSRRAAKVVEAKGD